MSTFSLLTLNCFGVPGSRTAARLRYLAAELNRLDAAMVCFQEVQSHAYRILLTQSCATRYPSTAYQPFVHAPKGGLLTLSRLPIAQHAFRLFEGRGLWYTPAVMDWILHKGMLASVVHVDATPVSVLNTHLTANYTGNWGRDSAFARQEQRELMQIAAWVKAQPDDHLVVVCGDFNIPRGSWLYDSLLSESGLHDPLAGDTRPTFRPYPGMGKRFGAAIDFTLYRPPAGVSVGAQSQMRCTEKVEIAGRKMYLSDHIGIETRFEWPAPQAE